MSITKELGQSETVALYEVPDTELAIGSTLGGPKAACIVKATGAIQLVYSIDTGQVLFGTVLVRHYDAVTGMHLTHEQPGTFVIHPEHQEHKFTAERHQRPRNHLRPQRHAGGRRARWTRRACTYVVELQNAGDEPVEMQTYAYADLRGQTGHDVVAEYDKALNALVAWNESQPDWVRLFGCSDAPASHETTLDYGKAVADASPGALSKRRTRRPTRWACFSTRRTIAPGETAQFYYVLSFGSGREEALANYRALPARRRRAGADEGALPRGAGAGGAGHAESSGEPGRTVGQSEHAADDGEGPDRLVLRQRSHPLQQQRRARHLLVRLWRRLPEPGFAREFAAGLCPQPGEERQGRGVLRYPQRQDRRLRAEYQRQHAAADLGAVAPLQRDRRHGLS